MTPSARSIAAAKSARTRHASGATLAGRCALAIVATGPEGRTASQLADLFGCPVKDVRSAMTAARRVHFDGAYRAEDHGGHVLYVANRHPATHYPRAAKLLAAVVAAGSRGVGAAEMAERFGGDPKRMGRELGKLAGCARIQVGRVDHASRYVAERYAKAREAVADGPTLVAGVGPRGVDATGRECVHYGGCLRRWLVSEEGIRSKCAVSQEAHCPPGCVSFAAQSRDDALEIATARTRWQGGEG